MYARTATGIAALAVLLGAGSATSAPGYEIDVNSRAVIAADHTVTTSGTYRCTGGSEAAPVYVSASVKQGGVSISGNSQKAVCDGQVHSWELKAQGFRDIRLEAGAATVEGHLVQIKPTSGLIPIETTFLASSQQQVELLPQD
ncbi:DUF6299 family protein [Streptomyces sp. Da 82-17]|uniref:DUF6299 family protein n=1 Tax=Streptomyces sp. Da 82-17 TaxID=3377116 RepID=UPI0038D44512